MALLNAHSTTRYISKYDNKGKKKRKEGGEEKKEGRE
jgi:hypothetical protein